MPNLPRALNTRGLLLATEIFRVCAILLWGCDNEPFHSFYPSHVSFYFIFVKNVLFDRTMCVCVCASSISESLNKAIKMRVSDNKKYIALTRLSAERYGGNAVANLL